MSLSFQTVPSIEAGFGKLSVLPDICRKLNIKKPIIVTDAGLFKLNYVNKINKILEKNDVSSCVYKDVLPDPPETNVFEAVELFKSFMADGVIGFGGGSSMDVAKAVSYFGKNKVSIEKCYGVNQLNNKRFPLIQIPTTAGTGSEVTSIAIFTLKEVDLFRLGQMHH